MSRQETDYCLGGQLHTFGTLNSDSSLGSGLDSESFSHALDPDETRTLKDITGYRERYWVLESQTICFQKETLSGFDALERKIRELVMQKQDLKGQFQLLSKELQEPSFIQRQAAIKAQNKKTKELPESLMRMHGKVTGTQCSILQAVCWLQRSLEAHSLIRKHSLEWKEAHEFVYGSGV